MKVAEQNDNYTEFSDYINNIKDCISTTKKLLVILRRQRDTLKESAFRYMVKEVRYELLKLLEKMLNNVKMDAQRSKDDVERDVFMVSCETMADELKIVGIREEWTLQQRHMAEIQGLIFEIGHQLSLHNSYSFTQAAVLMGLLSRILAEHGTVELLMDTTDFLELLQIMVKNLCSFFESHYNDCNCSCCDDEGHKCTLAISKVFVCISKDVKGAQFLKTSCTDVIEKFIFALPLVKCRPGERIKLGLLETLLNLSNSEVDLTGVKDFHRIFDDCFNHAYGKEIVQVALELLDKVISSGGPTYKQFLVCLEKHVRDIMSWDAILTFIF